MLLLVTYAPLTVVLCHTNFGINIIIETSSRAESRRRLDKTDSYGQSRRDSQRNASNKKKNPRKAK